MAWTEIYVDPSIAGDSGAGTVGDPYGDLEYAIEQSTFDTTNGTRVNIKAGTDEVLAATINTAMADTSVSIAWAPTFAAPLIFQGYTTAAGDGGIGGISGGGSVGIFTTDEHINVIDMHCHNTGSAHIIHLGNYCSVINCEVNNTSGHGINGIGITGLVLNNYVHDIGGYGIVNCTANLVANNYLENGAKTFVTAIDLIGATIAQHNIVSVAGASNGFRLGNYCSVINNSVYSSSGSGSGFLCDTGRKMGVIANNLVEGFSTGVGYDMDAATFFVRAVYGNASYNNGTHYTSITEGDVFSTDNETLTASPFTDAAGGDFSPVDTGNVKEGALQQTFGNPAQ